MKFDDVFNRVKYETILKQLFKSDKHAAYVKELKVHELRSGEVSKLAKELDVHKWCSVTGIDLANDSEKFVMDKLNRYGKDLAMGLSYNKNRLHYKVLVNGIDIITDDIKFEDVTCVYNVSIFLYKSLNTLSIDDLIHDIICPNEKRIINEKFIMVNFNLTTISKLWHNFDKISNNFIKTSISDIKDIKIINRMINDNDHDEPSIIITKDNYFKIDCGGKCLYSTLEDHINIIKYYFNRYEKLEDSPFALSLAKYIENKYPINYKDWYTKGCYNYVSDIERELNKVYYSKGYPESTHNLNIKLDTISYFSDKIDAVYKFWYLLYLSTFKHINNISNGYVDLELLDAIHNNSECDCKSCCDCDCEYCIKCKYKHYNNKYNYPMSYIKSKKIIDKVKESYIEERKPKFN